MSARSKGDYEIQCETLSAAAVEAAEKTGDSCAETLEAEAKNAPPASLVNHLEPIAALRIDGNRGVALYHANDGQDYAMPMELESGEWKVAATQPEPLPMN